VGVEVAHGPVAFKNTTEGLENLKAILKFQACHIAVSSSIFVDWDHLWSLTNKKVKGI